jgi:hypothetical protein
MLLHEKGVRDSECSAQKLCSQRGLDANSTIASLVSWNTASWIVTVIGVSAGVALLVTSRRDTPQRTAIAVAPTPGGVGVGLHGAF